MSKINNMKEDGQSGTDYEYRKAVIEDIEELVRTRIIVLRAANKLSDEENMGRPMYEKYGFMPMQDEMELL